MAKRSREKTATQQPERRTSGLVVALLALVFASFMASQWKERQRVAAVQVEGATGLSRLAIQRVVDTLLHKRQKTITLASVRQSVERIPYVRSASVFFTGVNHVCVEVVERLPVAHVMRENGQLRYVDQLGTILPPVNERTAHNVPLLHARGGDWLTATDVRSMVELLNHAATVLDARLYQSISEIRYDRRSGAVEVITDEATWKLGQLGRRRAFDALVDMNVFWTNASASQRLATVQEVDLRWRNQIVLKVRRDHAASTSGGAAA